jgi:hypothetical protein
MPESSFSASERRRSQFWWARVFCTGRSRYNDVRLHGAIGYVTPKDRLLGCDREIFRERDRKLEAARRRRAEARAAARSASEACEREAVPA